jgi:hypothetical protein
VRGAVRDRAGLWRVLAPAGCLVLLGHGGGDAPALADRQAVLFRPGADTTRALAAGRVRRVPVGQALLVVMLASLTPPASGWRPAGWTACGAPCCLAAGAVPVRAAAPAAYSDDIGVALPTTSGAEPTEANLAPVNTSKES